MDGAKLAFLCRVTLWTELGLAREMIPLEEKSGSQKKRNFQGGGRWLSYELVQDKMTMEINYFVL